MRLWNGRTAVLAVAGTIAVAAVASAASSGGDVWDADGSHPESVQEHHRRPR
jgi:hypothetical protein